jgi:hypothetical protein
VGKSNPIPQETPSQQSVEESGVYLYKDLADPKCCPMGVFTGVRRSNGSSNSSSNSSSSSSNSSSSQEN